MIDEKKLIDELKQSGMIADNEYGNAMIDMINNQSKIDEWIPCSERLPESGQRCLVSVVWEDEGAKTYSVYDAVYGSDAKWHSHNYEGMICCLIYCKVVAWQPLPEPCKE